MSFSMAIITVEIKTVDAIISHLRDASAGITNGAYFGYMLCQENPGSDLETLRFEPVASMGEASSHIVRVLPGELWTDSGFRQYLSGFFENYSVKIKSFRGRQAARDAYKTRKKELAAGN